MECKQQTAKTLTRLMVEQTGLRPCSLYDYGITIFPTVASFNKPQEFRYIFQQITL